MKLFFLTIAIAMIFITSCGTKEGKKDMNETNIFNQMQINQVINNLTDKYGNEYEERINRGVTQTAMLWSKADGEFSDFQEFCLDNFAANSDELDDLFETFSRNQEFLSGYFNRMIFDLKVPLHEDTGELNKLDYAYASYNPASYFSEDMFSQKIAFMIKLNFPFYSLTEKIELGKNWSRKQWAYAKLGDVFTSRVPGELSQKQSKISTESDSYIAEYNIFMGKIVDDEFNTFFPEDMKLISHWNLRDEIKSNYAHSEEGLFKQELIYKIMQNIINQDIPKEVINNGEYEWNPVTNKLYKDRQEVDFEKEHIVRYNHLHNNFKILNEIDEYSPHYPTYIERKFNQDMQMLQEDVEKLFVDFISSPVVKEVGDLIGERLGRDLQPFDIWYDGFKARSSLNQDELSEITRKQFPDAKAFDDYLPELLKKMKFSEEKANYLAERIEVNASRGAGHAWGAAMKGQKSHLRTRIPNDGMDYKGFNIAMHELGHNVEQTFSLYDVDYYALNGVPNTAFTEAMAFAFQHRDLPLIGNFEISSEQQYLNDLDIFWSSYEIMGVSVVDMRVWKWLYENPNSTTLELKETVIRIAKEVWNEFYAPVFGIEDQEILGIYSHMISYPLYLSAYPIGKLIEFQIEEHFEKVGGAEAFPEEVERMCVIGSILPNYWMQEAVGKDLTGQPMLDAAKKAVDYFK